MKTENPLKNNLILKIKLNLRKNEVIKIENKLPL
jgi:hypothetical protein